MANKSKAGSTFVRIAESGTADEINGLCIKLYVGIYLNPPQLLYMPTFSYYVTHDGALIAR